MKSKNVSLAVEIYPREGTETRQTREKTRRKMVEIYPREGTETIVHSSPFNQLMLKFIPVRGRKPDINLEF